MQILKGYYQTLTFEKKKPTLTQKPVTALLYTKMVRNLDYQNFNTTAADNETVVKEPITMPNEQQAIWDQATSAKSPILDILCPI